MRVRTIIIFTVIFLLSFLFFGDYLISLANDSILIKGAHFEKPKDVTMISSNYYVDEDTQNKVWEYVFTGENTVLSATKYFRYMRYRGYSSGDSNKGGYVFGMCNNGVDWEVYLNYTQESLTLGIMLLKEETHDLINRGLAHNK